MRSQFIRSPLWDFIWILNGLPLGLLLTCLTVTIWDMPIATDLWWSGVPLYQSLSVLTPWIAPGIIILWLIMMVDAGHLISPIVTAWIHREFRQFMLTRLLKYVVFPIFIFCVSVTAGVLAKTGIRFDSTRMALINNGDLTDPFILLAYIYLFWNAWHFAMQIFGFMAIYRRRKLNVPILLNSSDANSSRRKCSGATTDYSCSDPKISLPAPPFGQLSTTTTTSSKARIIDKAYCCAVIWAALAVPRLGWGLEKLHDFTGWPPGPDSQNPDAPGIPMGQIVPQVYLCAAILLVTVMLIREYFTVRSLPRAVLIATNGVAMISTLWLGGLWSFAIIAMNHWVAAIGLASHATANSRNVSMLYYAVGLMVLGAIIFIFLFVRPIFAVMHGLSLSMVSFTAPMVGFSIGLSINHFIYDRSIWKRTSLIGCDIFALRT